MGDCHGEASVRQCLLDAGCPPEVVERYCRMPEEYSQKTCVRRARIRLLREQRKRILEELHGCRCRLDCLDYMIFQLEHEQDEVTDS